VAEYTPAGTRVQVLAQVPPPGGGPGPTTEQARDLVVGPGNAVHLYNGTFDPFLARLDLGTSTWSQRTFDGWSTINNGTYGGIATLGTFVYVTDMRTFGTGDLPMGIVRFDTAGGPTVRFAESIEPSDLYIGPDGILYALRGDIFPNEEIFRFDPITFASLGTVIIPRDDNRAIAVAGDGSIFVATFDGMIRRLSPAGVVLDSLFVFGADFFPSNFNDINIDPFGRIALGTGFDGDIVLTDLSLDGFTRFRATDSPSGGDVFVTWVTTPAPAGFVLLLAGAAAIAALARRRKGPSTAR
jgi:hypothetical protein